MIRVYTKDTYFDNTTLCIDIGTRLKARSPVYYDIHVFIVDKREMKCGYICEYIRLVHF